MTPIDILKRLISPPRDRCSSSSSQPPLIIAPHADKEPQDGDRHTVLDEATHNINTALTSLQVQAIAVRNHGLTHEATAIEQIVRDISHALNVASVRAMSSQTDKSLKHRTSVETAIDGVMRALGVTLAERSVRWDKHIHSAAHVSVDQSHLLELLGLVLGLAVEAAHDHIHVETRHVDDVVELHVRSSRAPSAPGSTQAPRTVDERRERERALELINEFAKVCGAVVRIETQLESASLNVKLTLPAAHH